MSNLNASIQGTIWHHFRPFSGLGFTLTALALVGAVSLTHWQGTQTASPVILRGPSVDGPALPDVSPDDDWMTFVYLVGSQTQAEAVSFADAAARMELAYFGAVRNWTQSVIDTNTLEGSTLAGMVDADLAAWDPASGGRPPIEIVDLRSW